MTAARTKSTWLQRPARRRPRAGRGKGWGEGPRLLLAPPAPRPSLGRPQPAHLPPASAPPPPAECQALLLGLPAPGPTAPQPSPSPQPGPLWLQCWRLSLQDLPEAVLRQAGRHHEGAGRSGPLLGRLHPGLRHRLLRAQVQMRLPRTHVPGDTAGRTLLCTRTPCVRTDPHAHGPSYTRLLHVHTHPHPRTPGPQQSLVTTGHTGEQGHRCTMPHTCLAHAASQGHTWPGDGAQPELGLWDTPSGSSLSGRCAGLGAPGWGPGDGGAVHVPLPSLPGLRPHPGSRCWAGWGAGPTTTFPAARRAQLFRVRSRVYQH